MYDTKLKQYHDKADYYKGALETIKMIAKQKEPCNETINQICDKALSKYAKI